MENAVVLKYVVLTVTEPSTSLSKQDTGDPNGCMHCQQKSQKKSGSVQKGNRNWIWGFRFFLAKYSLHNTHQNEIFRVTGVKRDLWIDVPSVELLQICSLSYYLTEILLYSLYFSGSGFEVYLWAILKEICIRYALRSYVRLTILNNWIHSTGKKKVE